jgi:quercetin dioxygenase-like cupin family protein
LIEEEKMAEKSTYLRTHRLKGKALAFLLSEHDDDLRQRAAGAKNGRAAKTLVKQDTLRVTLVAIRGGTTIRQHQVEGPSTIHCLRGHVALDIEGRETELSTGALISLAEAVPHTLRAIDDSSILITISL